MDLEDETFLSRLNISIGNKVIQAKVMDKKKVQEKYDDAVASGNLSAYDERKPDQPTLSVQIGNILPN